MKLADIERSRRRKTKPCVLEENRHRLVAVELP